MSCRNSIKVLRGHGKALIGVQFSVAAPFCNYPLFFKGFLMFFNNYLLF